MSSLPPGARGRLTAALSALIPALLIAIADAILIQRHIPRDRLWLLAVYFIAPMLLIAIVSPLIRWRPFVILASAATLPAIGRYLLGARTGGAAFDRLSLNTVWFALVWLPAALALIALLGPRAGERDRTTAFGLRLWRPAAAFLLMVVTMSFVSKQGLPDELTALDAALALELFMLGIGLLIADLLPARAQKAALQWTWLLMLSLTLPLVIVAIDQVMTVRSHRASLRGSIAMDHSIRQDTAALSARYEAQGKLTPADRMLIAAHIAEWAEKERNERIELDLSPSPTIAALEHAVPAIALCVLYTALLVTTWRARRAALKRRAVEAALNAQSAVPGQ